MTKKKKLLKKKEKEEALIKPVGEYNNKSTYILGLDPARSGADETGIVILEKLPFQSDIFVAYIETLNTPDLTDAIGRVKYLHQLFNFKKIIVDETGLGAGVSDTLKKELGTLVEGIWYTSKSKAELFNNLKLLMMRKRHKLHIPNYTNSTNHMVKKMFFQFLSITQEYKEGSMVPKISHDTREHDDIINALALAASYFSIRKSMNRRYPLAGYNSS